MATFLKDNFTIFSAEIISASCLFLASVLVARFLGPSCKGIIDITILIPLLAVQLGGLGVEYSNVYFMARNKYPPRIIVGNSLFFAIITGISISIFVLISSPFFAKNLLAEDSIHYLYLASILPTFLLSNLYLGYVLLGGRKINQFVIVRIIRSVSYLLLVAFSVIILTQSMQAVIFSYILSILLALVAALFYVIQNGYLSWPICNLHVLLDSVKFGLRGHFGTIFQYFNYRFDIFLVAYFLDPYSVGQYSIAILIAEAIWYIPNSISLALMPRVASSDTEAANYYTELSSRNTILLTSILSVLLFLASGWLIPFVFTEKFIASITALKILLPGIIALSLWKIIINSLVGRGFPQYKSYTSFFSFIVMISLDLILIPRMGISGAALATLIAYAISALLALFWFNRVTGLNFYSMVVPKYSDLKVYGKFVISVIKWRRINLRR